MTPPSLSNNNIPHAQSSFDSPLSPPRKRALSDVSPEKISSSSIHGWRGDTVYSTLHQGETRAILQVPTSPPPPEFCAEANRRIRNALSCPAFDFSQHILHRTYVVRNLQFSPSEECVVMLDAAVESLLPHIYPPLPPCSIDAFVISPSREKAKGLFAQRTIRDLEVILSERPVVITPYVIGLAVPLPQLYTDIFRRLSKDILHNLVDLLPFPWEDDEPLIYEAIIRLNALAIALNVPDEKFAELPTHRGVFLQTSRCNHSCGPNAKWEWDQSTFSLVLTAVRQINPGEEITIAYVPPHLPHKVRESTLREMYGFACLCSFCSQAPEQLEKSDAAREWLTNFWRPTSAIPKFEEWCTDHSIPTEMLINAHHDAIHFITREGLHVLDTRSLSGSDAARPQRDIGRHLDHIAMCYGAMEDVDNFRKWIQKALEARENLTPEQKLAFKKWLSNPISFPVWGWRQNSSGHQYSGIVMDSAKVMLV
ncbi:hypothetical protein BJ912DRAFT_848234 [Pholiota molesta]|nr:hypothetical protein BJ912DRAFT_848234 [Pholiota molesta]